MLVFFLFFFNHTATTEIYTLSLHDALPIPSFTEDEEDTGDVSNPGSGGGSGGSGGGGNNDGGGGDQEDDNARMMQIGRAHV